MGFLTNYFDKKQLKKIMKTADKVDSLAEKYAKMTDEEMKKTTALLKEKYTYSVSAGKKDDDILNELLPDAYALVREAGKRVVGEYAYKVQIMGAIALNNGDIAEMSTGSGKTLTELMPAYLNALTGKGVHIITVNEYLSERDRYWVGKVFEFLGLTVGLNKKDMSPEEKRASYNCDITYVTNNEAGFDYLRDNMVKHLEEKVHRSLNYAIVDEADSVLIDDARTPLIISSQSETGANLYLHAQRCVASMKRDVDYSLDEREKTFQILEPGIDKVEKAFGIKDIYTEDNSYLIHFIYQAMKANYLFKRDIDYIVREESDEVLIVDKNTGRAMPGRQWSDGLHQAIQAKENISIKPEDITVATITFQNFFRLYNKLSGMTGTAKTDEEEFMNVYNMRVVQIPDNKPVIRIDDTDRIFGTKNAKYKALLEDAEMRHKNGQPVLIGTADIATSELLSKMFDKEHIPHEVLNAKNDKREAEIVAKAGQKGAVTIATNMAGRGTDIKLGDGVAELGGLAVLGSERHESRRIDNQLRGRSGRQGDPGYSRFYVSAQDTLIKRYGNESMENALASLGDEEIQSKSIASVIKQAQERIEGINYDAREDLLKYDNVLAAQREDIYRIRNEIMTPGKFNDAMKEIFESDIYNEDKLTQEQKEIVSNIVLSIIDKNWINQIDFMSKLKESIKLRAYAQQNPFQAYIIDSGNAFVDMKNRIREELKIIIDKYLSENNMEGDNNKKED